MFRRLERLIGRLFRQTEKVVTNVDPARYREHRYGLTPRRWDYLAGKNYWITGAGSGYGRALAIALASAGAQVFLTGRRVSKLQETIREMESINISGGNCYIVEGDITDPEQVTRACERIMELCPTLDGLINNAAINDPNRPSAPLQKSSLEVWNQMINTNVTAHWLLTRSIWSHLQASGHVRVLFISSMAGWEASTGFGIYNINKAALNSLTHSLASEYSDTYPGEDIQINALALGNARTEMNPNSNNSPYQMVCMALILLTHPHGGPNGRFFHQNGQHLSFGLTGPFGKPLI